MTTYCPTTAQQVGPDHRCPACSLQGDLARATAAIEYLTREFARVDATLAVMRGALHAERDAHALTNRKLENALVGVTRCPDCRTPTHATESDDDGRCVACMLARGVTPVTEAA